VSHQQENIQPILFLLTHQQERLRETASSNEHGVRNLEMDIRK
jgi:hypothetical protein